MFTSGFEKTADIAGALGKSVGMARKGTIAAKKGVTEFVAGRKQSFRAGKASAYGRTEGAIGAGLAKRETDVRRAAGHAPNATESASIAKDKKSDVFNRYHRMNEHQASKKKSFASKHPFLTAGGLYLGARAAFGGDDGEKKTPQQPQVYPGQY